MTERLTTGLSHFLRDQSGDWCIYKPLDSEISLEGLLPKVSHIKWVYPKVMGDRLCYYEPSNGFEKGFAGVWEPVVRGTREVSLQEISGFLVPAVGFDRTGVRLGKGKGYYDRALQNFMGLTVGISFDSLVVKKLPADSWDLRVQWLATENGVKKVV